MKKAILLFSCMGCSIMAYTQIGIGTTTPNSTLDVRGSLATNIRTVTAATTLTATDYTVVFTGTTATTLTLPTAVTCQGRVYAIKNASVTVPTPVLTLATTSSQTIDGSTTWLLDEPNEVVFLKSNGTNWQIDVQDVPVAKSTTTGGPWNQGGNSVTAAKNIGTKTNFDFPFITNNVERMRISNVGDVAIGTSTFDATYPEQLLVDAGTTTSVNAICGKGTINSYLQLNIQNKSASTGASSDIVATADNGNETTNYVDLGINSSGNTSTGTIGGANNTYLYSQANDFSIGNATAAKNLIFFTGGTLAANERMRIDGSGNIGVGTTAPASTLDAKGSLAYSYRAVTAATTLTATDNTIVFTGTSAATITLPTAATCLGRVYTIKNASTTVPTPVLTVATTSSQTIDGTTTTVISSASTSITLISDGANWRGFSSNSQAVFTGATASLAGVKGLVPAPAAGDQNKFLTGSGAWTASLPFIIANGTNSSTTEVRDYNTWVTRGTGFYITDVAAAISNPIPNEGAWFTFSQVGQNGGYFGQTALNDHDYYYRGDATSNLSTSVWYRMLQVPATSKTAVQVDASNNVTMNNIDNGFLAFATNNTERMRLTAAGNTGIGTSTFDATYPEKLLVDAGTTTSVNSICGKGTINSYLQLNIQNKSAGTGASSDLVATADNGSETANYVDLGINSSGNTSTGTIGGANNAYLYSQANDFGIGNATAAKNLLFFTGGTAATNERIRIDGSGNVGIGTTSPTTTLDIKGTYSGYTGGLKLENVTGPATSYIIPGVGVGGTASSVSVLYEIAGTGFHVFGDHVIPDGNNTWDLGTTANRWRDVWCSRGAFNGSDRRMKKNITPLDYGLKELLKINTYSYNWIDPKMDDGYRYLGVIAQELKEIMPELIRESNEGDKFMSVNYTGLIPVLINAVKQQQQLIDQLSKQNASLQNQSKDVKTELDGLKAEMKTITEYIKNIPAAQAQR